MADYRGRRPGRACGWSVIDSWVVYQLGCHASSNRYADERLVGPSTIRLFVENFGYEYGLLRLAACVTLVLTRPGRMALDNVPAFRKSTGALGGRGSTRS